MQPYPTIISTCLLKSLKFPKDSDHGCSLPNHLYLAQKLAYDRHLVNSYHMNYKYTNLPKTTTTKKETIMKYQIFKWFNFRFKRTFNVKSALENKLQACLTLCLTVSWKLYINWTFLQTESHNTFTRQAHIFKEVLS